MLSKTLSNIETYLNSESNLTKQKITKLLEKLKFFEINSYLTPYDFKIFANLTEDETYHFFADLTLLDIVKPVYKLYCPRCSKVSSRIFEELEDMEEHEFCEKEYCGYEFVGNKYKYIILLYKVINE